MAETIDERVIEVIARNQKIPPEQISLASTFDELGMTSLDALGLVFDLEEEFNVAVPNEDAMRISNVGQAVGIIQKLVNESKPEGWNSKDEG